MLLRLQEQLQKPWAKSYGSDLVKTPVELRSFELRLILSFREQNKRSTGRAKKKKNHLEFFKLFIFQVTQEYAFQEAGIVQKQLELSVTQLNNYCSVLAILA